MSLHKDYEPIRGQLLNRIPPSSLDIAVNELVGEEARLATLQAQNKLNVLAIAPSAPPIKQPPQSGFDSSSSSNCHKQTNEKFCNYYKRLGHAIETCYHCSLLRRCLPFQLNPSLLDPLSTSAPLNYWTS